MPLLVTIRNLQDLMSLRVRRAAHEQLSPMAAARGCARTGASRGSEPVPRRVQASESAIAQRRHGSRRDARRLYYEAHATLRAFRHYFLDRPLGRRRVVNG